MIDTIAYENRADATVDPAVHVSVILGGLWGPDGYTWSQGIVALAQSIQRNMPHVQVRTWTWDLFDQVFQHLQELPKSTKRILVGYSGGGSRITYVAKERPLQRIDLAIGYDPSPRWQMMPLGPNVTKAICFHCLNPNLGDLGGGLFTGIETIETVDTNDSHLQVQWDKRLHKRTLQEIAGLSSFPIADKTIKKLLADSGHTKAAPKDYLPTFAAALLLQSRKQARGSRLRRTGKASRGTTRR
jgi:hypothetical protein